MEISKPQFLEQRHRKFGRENPERMNVPFWQMMVRNGKGAYWATDHFHAADDQNGDPVWCFDRYGMSQTRLADGRTLCIAGEHEDYYDPDFCIYNDLVVKHPDDRIDMFGYPQDVFPPTDFHSATLVDDRIILMGNVGYMEERKVGQTPVYALALSDFRMAKIEVSGELPGWLSRHEAQLESDGSITVRGGQVLDICGGRERFRKNLEEFSLDPATGRWRQITQRLWQQYLIRPEVRQVGSFLALSKIVDILPTNIPHSVLNASEWDQMVLLVEGVQVVLSRELDQITIVIEGCLPGDLGPRIVEEIRGRAEAIAKDRYVLEQI